MLTQQTIILEIILAVAHAHLRAALDAMRDTEECCPQCGPRSKKRGEVRPIEYAECGLYQCTTCGAITGPDPDEPPF